MPQLNFWESKSFSVCVDTYLYVDVCILYICVFICNITLTKLCIYSYMCLENIFTLFFSLLIILQYTVFIIMPDKNT